MSSRVCILSALFGYANALSVASMLPAQASAGMTLEARLQAAGTINWVDARSLGLGGLAYRNYGPEDAPYGRLPAAAQNDVPPYVWMYSRDSSGMFVQFTSDASAIHVNFTLTSANISTWTNFPPTGFAGVDLYRYDTATQVWRWVATSFNGLERSPTRGGVVEEIPLFADSWGWPEGPIPTLPTLNATYRYRLHFPSYNGVHQMSVGVPAGAALVADVSWNTSLPITYYGTSIAQGGVTTRPGQTFVSRLSRSLNVTINNMGFCGACRMEMNLSVWLARAPSSMFVVDCGWNMEPADIAAAAVPFLRSLRSLAPNVPIVLVEPTPYPPSWLLGDVMNVTGRREELAAAFANLTATGVQQLYYVPGSALYAGAFRDPTFEGVHPLDYGHSLLANALTAALTPIMRASAPRIAALPSAELGAHHRAAARSVRTVPPLRADSASDGSQPLDDVPSNVTWVDATALTMNGRAFNDTPSPYNRLPAAAQSTVRSAVWDLSLNSAGISVSFNASCANLYVDYGLASTVEYMVHFAATGVSGADLYAWDAASGTQRFVAPMPLNYGTQRTTALLVSGLPLTTVTYTLWLATYNTVTGLRIGVDPGCSLTSAAAVPPPPPTTTTTMMHAGDAVGARALDGPVVWYGTSILQGGVDVKVGNIFSSTVARGLPAGVALYNFGFSGNCLMETDVAQWLVTVSPPPSVFIIDCNHNMDAAQIAAAALPLVQFMRAALPRTTIVLAEGTEFGRNWVSNDSLAFQLQSNANLHAAYVNASANDTNLAYVAQAQLFAAGGMDALDSPTAAGLHPDDAGMTYVAQLWSQYLGDVLRKRAIARHWA